LLGRSAQGYGRTARAFYVELQLKLDQSPSAAILLHGPPVDEESLTLRAVLSSQSCCVASFDPMNMGGPNEEVAVLLRGPRWRIVRVGGRRLA
jgi:hypothetical protein